ncbi:hypothetical protein CHUAL_010362 [Chamberlinius hualienensis]
MSSSAMKSSEETINFLYRTMVERDPKKRRVKPVDSHLLQLNFGELDDSSDDSDFRLEEHEDADTDSDDSNISDDKGNNNSSAESSGNEDKDDGSTEDSRSDGGYKNKKKPSLTIAELIEQARIKQSQARQRIAQNSGNAPEYKILVCAVCVGDISEQDDEIVECDGCGVSVHEGCYGITDVESVSSSSSSSSMEPWFCDACKAGNKDPDCELCPNKGGIFKETDVGKWVHVVCGLYIPGVAFGNVDKLSSVTLFEMPYSKWGAKSCVLCEDDRFSRTGVCISCDAGLCKNYFHVTCAQKEGLLSEASPEEVKDIADPFFAYCKLHADKFIVRSKKRNWMALQSRIKQKKEEISRTTPAQLRINKKLEKRRLKYLEMKATSPPPWVPTQKMSRLLTSSPSACRKLIIKSELMDINTRASGLGIENLGDIRKKWHISPAFNVEFVSYYLDRNERMISMQSRLDSQLQENQQLQEAEQTTMKKYEQLLSESESLKSVYNDLHDKALNLWKIVETISGKKIELPDVLLPKQLGKSNSKLEKKFDGKSFGSVTLNKCGLCNKSKDQHLLAKCDTCQLYYHLGCLDPPLTRMPKKNKSQGWQCSECDKTDEGEIEEEVDPNAPRKLREHIKEPRKFTPPASNESSSSSSSGTGVINGHTKSDDGTPLTNKRKIKNGKKRSLVSKKLSRRSLLTMKKNEKVVAVSTVTNPSSGVSILKKQLTPEKPKLEKEPTVELTKTKSPSKQLSIKLLVKTEQSLTCCKCNQLGSKSSLVRCDLCGKCYHFPCLDPPVKKSPKQRGYVWHCEECDDDAGDESGKEEDTDDIPAKKIKKAKCPMKKNKKKKRCS